MPSVALLIVSAGKGDRFGGGVPKQYRSLAGQTILRRTILALSDVADGLIQVVVGPDHLENYAAATAGLDLPMPVLGGATRQDSVRSGLESLSAKAPDFVLIHDAARPLVTHALVLRVLAALEKGVDAAIPMVAMADTLRRQNADGSWSLVPRDGIWRAQTPQGFRFAEILKAHREFKSQSVTDDMALAEAAGLSIARVDGEETNMKITTQDDLAHAERLLAGAYEFRTGSGFDVHRFTEGDHVWLCGIRIDHTHALEGHSDADAGLHALTDAILGAIGAGDIGQHFPPSDERWRNAASDRFLAHANDLLHSAGGQFVHGDVTLICERPKIGPHREAMRVRIAEILGIPLGRISVKATTTEGLGFTGRREGLAAEAVVTVKLPA
ncbi:MAG: bifunctional 2-C-methyl-D-erythritol 4-phosphate cytidylyltransferase/2-C-methyl-D-erythritol 2,4-cyclodiphosphate synthase [Alphaproteobacteria bacterium]|nr:bifunctional 2-C-methyl-D-erythritol 4-phosphate cytidylyltransferase/2-C-methyl-D-erythritol 2,4-cyclodiphosphate synthase [Alphaproteobacteria bacterium]